MVLNPSGRPDVCVKYFHKIRLMLNVLSTSFEAMNFKDILLITNKKILFCVFISLIFLGCFRNSGKFVISMIGICSHEKMKIPFKKSKLLLI